MKRHQLDIQKWLPKIENVQARLKWSVPPSKIISWLENFDEKDAETAYDLLLLFEYITFKELQARFDEMLQIIRNEVGEDTSILIIPYGKFGKSGPMMGYPIKNTSIYNKPTSHMELDWNFRARKISEKTAIVMIDDFVGTGETFAEHYNLDRDGNEAIRKWADRNNIKKRYLLSAIVMTQAVGYIQRECGSDIRIIAEFRERAFNSRNSIFDVFHTKNKLLKVVREYGKNLGRGPLGYKDSEAIVAFGHTTPDNTLGVIWGDEKWNPIFPRLARTRIDQARELKKEIAFHIGVMNRLKLDLYNNNELVTISTGQMLEYNKNKDHALLTYIKLKIDGVETYVIAQIIGLTQLELKELLKTGRDKKLIDALGRITPIGHEFFYGLTKKANKYRSRSHNAENYKPANSKYLPKEINGVACRKR